MSCIYSDSSGKCTLLWDEDTKESSASNPMCLDEDGNCCVEYDPDPCYSCESFVSVESNECPECGEDMELLDYCDYCGYCVVCGSPQCECE